ncbi:MAG: hypothetical protein COB67_03325 [SAR324 cluster bacterium]|uniref:Uncharacterized protein n=1 Tax=SAR324 cluster bacterium TaxID=2024889 RepID=A0A2A4T814_9DELT|nr:MAG: hypothetical protein COB67_03325 [SAR324 cluster bacterium]
MEYSFFSLFIIFNSRYFSLCFIFSNLKQHSFFFIQSLHSNWMKVKMGDKRVEGPVKVRFSLVSHLVLRDSSFSLPVKHPYRLQSLLEKFSLRLLSFTSG